MAFGQKLLCGPHHYPLTQMLKSLGQVDLDEQVLHMTGRGVLAKASSVWPLQEVIGSTDIDEGVGLGWPRTYPPAWP